MSRATLCLQYRLIIQFFMVAALVATNVFNVFTMNLGTTGLPLGQVCSVDADAIHRIAPCVLLTPCCLPLHCVTPSTLLIRWIPSRADVHFVLLQGDSFRDSQLGFTLTAVVSCAGSAVLLFLSLAYMRYKRMLMW